MDHIQIYGLHPVREALRRALPLRKIFIKKTASGELGAEREELLNMAKEANIQFRFEEAAYFDHLSVEEALHQGIAAELKKESPVYDNAASYLQKKPQAKCLLACDQITDPQNFGSLFRTALFFGCDAVLSENAHSAPLSSTVHKVSTGASLLLPALRVEKLAQALLAFKDQGFQICAFENRSDSIALSDWEVPEKTILVFGSEHDGIRPHILRLCDKQIKIPAAFPWDSLNVGVSAGIAMHYYSQSTLQ